MPYPSPADEDRNGGCGPLVAAVLLLFIVFAAASCARQAMGGAGDDRIAGPYRRPDL